MKQYNAAEPLIYLHIPKCAGTSMNAILRKWFAANCARHYPNVETGEIPTKHELKPGMLVFGHFINSRGFGAADYYPGVKQFITLMREPLELQKSSYFHWKGSRRSRLIKVGRLQEGAPHDYQNIDDFFTKRGTCPIFNFVPFEFTEDNFVDILEKHFVYIGVVGDLQTSVDKLAGRLGLPSIDIKHANRAQRNEQLSASVADEFIRKNRFAYAIYDYALKKYKD